MNRLSLILALGVATSVAGAALGQTPMPTPTTAPIAQRTDKPRVAVFNTALVMKQFEKFQYYAVSMANERVKANAELGKLRAIVQELDKKLATETRKDQQDAIQKELINKQRAYDDAERAYRKQLDEQSALHLKSLYSDITRAVQAIVEANGYDLVLAYPDAVTVEEANNPLYYDLKLRPPAAIPFYVSRTVDITPTLIKTLNDSFKAPGPVPQPLAPTGPVQTSGVGGVAPVATPGGGVAPTPPGR